jgi:hypothetical protein
MKLIDRHKCNKIKLLIKQLWEEHLVEEEKECKEQNLVEEHYLLLDKHKELLFNNALNAFQQNQSLQTQAGLQGGAQLGQLGTVQQSMAQGDINQLMAGGGLQRQLGQQALDAARQTTLQQQYEPFQRAEFLKNIYAAGPTSQSAITSTTSPGTNPLAQAAGAGLGAYATYSALNRQPAAVQTAFNTQATVR